MSVHAYATQHMALAAEVGHDINNFTVAIFSFVVYTMTRSGLLCSRAHTTPSVCKIPPSPVSLSCIMPPV